MQTRVLGLALALALSSACPVPEPIARKLDAAIAVDADGNPNPKAPPEVLNNYANELDDGGNHEQALRFYDAALARYRDDDVQGRSGCMFNKGLTLRRLQRWEQSVAAYEAAHALQPTRKIAINISIPLVELRRFDDAIVWLDRELVDAPDDIALVETKAHVLIDAERHAEARPVVERALAIRERSGRPADRRYIAHWRQYLAASNK